MHESPVHHIFHQPATDDNNDGLEHARCIRTAIEQYATHDEMRLHSSMPRSTPRVVQLMNLHLRCLMDSKDESVKNPVHIPAHRKVAMIGALGARLQMIEVEMAVDSKDESVKNPVHIPAHRKVAMIGALGPDYR